MIMGQLQRAAWNITWYAGSALSMLLVAASCAHAQTPPPAPLLKEGATVKVSNHVWVIPDGGVPLVPNVGIIVGSRATMIVDTGLGIRNGEIVLRELAKVSKNKDVYVATTHFHAEHTTGGTAFPPHFKFMRPTPQQKDVEEFGAANVAMFAKRTPELAELLEGSKFPNAEIMFEREYSIDLGGVRVRITWLGPTHTRGDTVIFVEGENVLFSGDLAMKQQFPSFSSPYGDAMVWLASLDALEAMRPKVVVGSHGGIGDAAMIHTTRDVFKAIEARTRELKAQGMAAAEIGKLLTNELAVRYPDWVGPVRVPALVAAYYKLP
jgi:glyoxylase-like metal-dependent hydrolase (beta-lactamase superfamily II)